MSNAISLRTFTVSITSTQGARIEAAGNFIACLAASEDFVLSINDGPGIYWAQGLNVKLPDDVRGLYITPKAGALPSQTITMLIGYVGDFTDGRLSLSAPLNIAAGNFVGLQAPQNLVTPAALALTANTNTVALAANAKTVDVVIQNTGSVPVRISGTTGTLSGTQGLQIAAGATASLTTSGAIYARAIGGAGSLEIAYTQFS